MFSDYTAGEGFFTGKGKKNQFPDAFIFECLKPEASSEEPVIIVSEDRDFEEPVEDEDHISLVKSLPELFKTLGLQADKPEIEDFLECHEEELIKAVNDGLDPWSLIVTDVEDAEIEEIDVTEVEGGGAYNLCLDGGRRFDSSSRQALSKGGRFVYSSRLGVFDMGL